MAQPSRQYAFCQQQWADELMHTEFKTSLFLLQTLPTPPAGSPWGTWAAESLCKCSLVSVANTGWMLL